MSQEVLRHQRVTLCSAIGVLGALALRPAAEKFLDRSRWQRFSRDRLKQIRDDTPNLPFSFEFARGLLELPRDNHRFLAFVGAGRALEAATRRIGEAGDPVF